MRLILDFQAGTRLWVLLWTISRSLCRDFQAGTRQSYLGPAGSLAKHVEEAVQVLFSDLSPFALLVVPCLVSPVDSCLVHVHDGSEFKLKQYEEGVILKLKAEW